MYNFKSSLSSCHCNFAVVCLRITKTVEPFSWAKTKRYQPAVALERLPAQPKKAAAAAKKRPNAESASSIAKRIRLSSILAESESREVGSSDQPWF